MNIFTPIKGILFDLDGVLYIGPKATEGAIEAIEDRVSSAQNTTMACFQFDTRG